MSREIRPVALDWEHPLAGGTYSDGRPRYVPLHSREDLRIHLDSFAADPEDWDNEEPDPADYMPEIPEGTPYGWQMYETVSEGSPVSPVCKTKDELAAWLSSTAAGRNQVSPAAAAAFVDAGWAPTGMSLPGHGYMSGVAASEFMNDAEGAESR